MLFGFEVNLNLSFGTGFFCVALAVLELCTAGCPRTLYSRLASAFSMPGLNTYTYRPHLAYLEPILFKKRNRKTSLEK